VSENRLYLQIPLISPEEQRRLYEEWIKEQEEEKLKEKEVIIIDMV
tara:strand:- start:801 stop:938 length:138 start_codon:yes stop_codon:yes gene_type:complete